MKIAIVIPAYNEEKSIEQSIRACLDQTRKADEIIIINDGSTDNTGNIIDSFGTKVKHIYIKTNTGNKSRAQQVGINHVTSDVFVTTDADSVLDKDFLKNVEESFTDKKVVALGGYVKSLKCNWLTACRELDYIIGQDLHKTAQSYINSLFVIPGCAGAFRTSVFKKHISFDHDTITEDLDFTYKLNKNNFKIFYNKKAVVYTQDPNSVSEYVKQMRRWYGGGWQNLYKHLDSLKRTPASLELSLIYIEGMFFSILSFILPVINIYYYFIYLGLFFLYSTTLGVYGAIKRKRLDLLLYSPAYVLLFFLNAYVFLSEFYSEIIRKRKKLNWFKPERRVIVN